jgi:hypothetical protein
LVSFSTDLLPRLRLELTLPALCFQHQLALFMQLLAVVVELAPPARRGKPPKKVVQRLPRPYKSGTEKDVL